MKKILLLFLMTSCLLFAREYQRSDFASSSSLEGLDYETEDSTYIEPKALIKEDSVQKTEKEVATKEVSIEKTLEEKEHSK
ncbi:MAG: hypothetical protein ACJAWW_000732 [Sulfurimonas sp.]|jgi:hypothetical protein